MEDNLKKYIVYCTINNINKKIYIGVHYTNPNIFDNYIGNGVYTNNRYTYERSKTKFQRAVCKYGYKNFTRKTLAIFDDPYDAYELEESIVNEDFLKRHDVYNMALGGIQGAYVVTCKKCYQYDLDGNFVQEYKSYKDAACAVGRALIGIQRAIKDKTRCNNYYFTNVKYDKLDLSLVNQIKETDRKIPIYQYSITGEYECCYESATIAAQILGKDKTNILNAVKLEIPYCNKYFSDTFMAEYSQAKSERINNRKIFQYALTGEFISEYSNMQEAKNKLGIKTNIYRAIKLGRCAGGFQWSFVKLDSMEAIKPKSGRARRVGKYTIDGEFIKEYPSKAQCEKENGRGVSHVLEGRDLTHKGYIYKYLS